MILLKSLTTGVICSKCEVPNHLNFFMIFMNDYHEFKHAHEVHVEEWKSYWSSNYAFIIKIFVISTFVFTLGVIGMTFRNDLTNGVGMLVPMGPLEIMEA